MLYQLSYSRPSLVLFVSPGHVKEAFATSVSYMGSIRETDVACHSMTRVYACVALASWWPGLDTSTP